MPSIGDLRVSAAGVVAGTRCLRPPKCCRPHGRPVAVRRTRPRALSAPSLLPFSIFPPSSSLRRRGGGAISARAPCTRHSCESGAAAGGLRVSELTALRARGRGRVGPGKTGAWSASGSLENAKGEKTATGRPEGHAGAGSVRDAPGLTSLRPSHVSLWGWWSPSPPEPRKPMPIRIRPQIRRDNPLNLSILLSGGKETNKDSLSKGD